MEKITAVCAPKSGNISISISIPLNANPHEFIAAKNGKTVTAGIGSNAAAWYAAASTARISYALCGTPSACDKHRITGFCARVHCQHFVVSVSAPKRGASISAIVRTILTECCRVPFVGFKLAAQTAGNPVPSKELHESADKAMQNGAASAKIHLIGPMNGTTNEKKAAALDKYITAAKKGVTAADVSTNSSRGTLVIQKDPVEFPGLTGLSAKGPVAYALCEYLKSANILAYICGDHVWIPNSVANKVAQTGKDADKRTRYQAKLSRGDMHSLMWAANLQGFPSPGNPPTPSNLASSVFSAMK